MLGLWIGGPLAIILFTFAGAVAGHFYDNANALPPEDPLESIDGPRSSLMAEPELPSPESLDEQAQEHFARHLCALFIEVARVDGDVARDEVRVVREYFQDQLKYGPEALDMVRLHLKEFLAEASRRGRLHRRRAGTSCPSGDRLLLVDTLYELALVDGALKRSEQESLRQIAKGLGLTEEDRRAVGRPLPGYRRHSVRPARA